MYESLTWLCSVLYKMQQDDPGGISPTGAPQPCKRTGHSCFAADIHYQQPTAAHDPFECKQQLTSHFFFKHVASQCGAVISNDKGLLRWLTFNVMIRPLRRAASNTSAIIRHQIMTSSFPIKPVGRFARESEPVRRPKASQPNPNFVAQHVCVCVCV